MKSLYTTVVLMFLFMGNHAYGQYSEYLQPQGSEDIARLKKFGIQFVQITKEVEQANDTFHSVTAYDTNGRQIFIKSIDKTIAYLYDDEGRVVHRRDTVMKYGVPNVSELNANYDKLGMLKAYKTENNLSSFKYDPQTHQLFEQVMQGKGSFLRRYYKYDDKKRLVYRLFADAKGKPIEEQNIRYTIFSKPDKEKITEYKPNYAKSATSVAYTYNEKKLLTGRFITTVDNFGDSLAEKNGFIYNPTTTTQNFNYEYDDKGNQIKEVCIFPETNRLNYSITRTFDDRGFVVREMYRNYQGVNTYSLNYKYIQRGDIKLPNPHEKGKGKKKKR